MDTPGWLNEYFGPGSLFLRYGINLLAVLVLVRLIYYRQYQRTDLFLTFFSFNSIIFFVTHLLNKVEMSTGAAFGLFAVFSILRYRTEGLSAKDMTYLFLSIALGLLTAVSGDNLLQLGAICVILLLLTLVLEGGFLLKTENSRQICYDNASLLQAGRETELLNDLKAKTGLSVTRVSIEEIDFVKDSGRLTIFYKEPR